VLAAIASAVPARVRVWALAGAVPARAAPRSAASASASAAAAGHQRIAGGSAPAAAIARARPAVTAARSYAFTARRSARARAATANRAIVQLRLTGTAPLLPIRVFRSTTIRRARGGEGWTLAPDDLLERSVTPLADRLAEAFAERLHQHVRESIWGYGATEHLSNVDLIRETYKGIRPAPGYPACPDHSLKPLLFGLLGHDPAGVTLTDNFAMLPASAVSGFYFGHRDSQYFGVAKIGQDQLVDYAARREVDVETATRWLRPNLD